MHRIDADGFAPGNLFTEGSPGVTPATTVSADWLNDVQENLAQFIENQGLTLTKGDYTQLEDAINAIIASGGATITQSLSNNAGPLDVTGLLFNSANVKHVIAQFRIFRRTDTQDVSEAGELHFLYDEEAAAWLTPVIDSKFGDAGTVISITAGGQVQYTTDDLTGTTYSGTLKVTNIKTLA